MSIKLVLSHYLSGLRERDELDALLPELLLAMGHSVLSRAQVGVNQGGVDILSTFQNGEQHPEVFLFVIKFGNVSRADMYSGQQAISPSILQAVREYLRNRLQDSLRDAKKRIVLVSNGILKQDAQSDFAALSKDVSEASSLCSLEFWGIDQLTPLIEQYLFDDALLLEHGKADLRAAVAGLEDTHASVSRFVRFVEHCLTGQGSEKDASDQSRKNRFYKRAAAAAMGWAVLLVWGESEGNQKPGVLAGEYLLLRLWSEAIRKDVQQNAQFLNRFKPIAELHSSALQRYYNRLMPSLLNRRSVLRYRPDQVLYIDLVCEELGRLGTALLLLHALNADSAILIAMHDQLISFLDIHDGCLSPVLDDQTIDLSLAMAALMASGDFVSTQAMLRQCVERFEVAILQKHIMPVDTDDIEDALALRNGEYAQRGRFFKTTTLIPALGTMAALVKDQKSLDRLSKRIVPELKGVTMERWYPQLALQTLTGSDLALNSIGVSRDISGFRNSPEDEIDASLKLPAQSASPREFEGHGSPWEVLIALSARLHRHPLPTWYLAKCAGVQTTI